MCRNLHKLIHSAGKTLRVELSTVTTPVQVLCGKPGVRQVYFPVLHLSSWAKLILGQGGQMLLGGFTLDQETEFRTMLATFWRNYKYVRPELDLYARDDFDLSTTIPMGYHGDEGRGKLKRPLMVLAHQPIISHKGPQFTNLSGCLPCTAAFAQIVL